MGIFDSVKDVTNSVVNTGKDVGNVINDFADDVKDLAVDGLDFTGDGLDAIGDLAEEIDDELMGAVQSLKENKTFGAIVQKIMKVKIPKIGISGDDAVRITHKSLTQIRTYADVLKSVTSSLEKVLSEAEFNNVKKLIGNMSYIEDKISIEKFVKEVKKLKDVNPESFKKFMEYCKNTIMRAKEVNEVLNTKVGSK